MESDFFSLPALAKAIETRDSKAMRGFYDDNARLRIIDSEHSPSHPQELVGRGAIAAYFDDVCGRTMTHKLERGVVDGDQLAFTQACAYPDGKRVFCSAMAQLKAGLIVSETVVQAWDA